MIGVRDLNDGSPPFSADAAEISDHGGPPRQGVLTQECTIRLYALSESGQPPMTSSSASAPADDLTSAQGRRQRSRIGLVTIGGHFDPAVATALKVLAAQQGTTVQALMGRAFNDLLERHGFGRPASEAPLPRGAAAPRGMSSGE